MEILPSVGTPLLWGVFFAIVLVVLALDLGVFHRHAHTPSPREAAAWSAAWIALSLGFCGWLAWTLDAETASAFLTAYVLEKSLSIDNLFVFVLVFGAMKIPDTLQHRVLFWGILGAIALRAVMIALGAALLSRFHWLMIPFGGLLVWGGIKLFREWRRGDGEPDDDVLLALVNRHLPMSKERDGEHFFTRQDGRLLATPLLGALVLVELSDIVFAVDSIPAALAISQDPFVVLTSNVFAILGLRSLYFFLIGALKKLRDLKAGLAAVLVFVGVKMIGQSWFHVPPGISLAIILSLLALPLFFGRRLGPAEPPS